MARHRLVAPVGMVFVPYYDPNFVAGYYTFGYFDTLEFGPDSKFCIVGYDAIVYHPSPGDYSIIVVGNRTIVKPYSIRIDAKAGGFIVV